MKLLLTGANGQLGSEIKRHSGLITQHQLFAFTKDELDITRLNILEETVNRYQPDLIINAAAHTQVDKAEHERELALAVNTDGPSNLATTCSKFNIPLIHISTDYVFNGQKQGEYSEDDLASPINFYGLTKWEGEQQIRKKLDKHIILRTSWVYGFYGHNFVKTILRLAREREQLNIVNDQYGCPTAAQELANIIYEIIQQMNSREFNWGTYHFCNGPATTWHEFAKAITAIASNYESLCVKEIKPIKTEQYPTPAQRPLNSSLAVNKLSNVLKIIPRSWREVLPEVIKELYS